MEIIYADNILISRSVKNNCFMPVSIIGYYIEFEPNNFNVKNSAFFASDWGWGCLVQTPLDKADMTILVYNKI